MKRYAIMSLILLFAVSLFSATLVEKWSVFPEDFDWFCTEYGTKGAAVSPVTGNVIVAVWDRAKDPFEASVRVLSSVDGSELGTLTPPAEGYRIDYLDSMAGVSKVVVLPSGKVLVTNHTTTADHNNKLFVWENENVGGAEPLVVTHTFKHSDGSGNVLAAVEKDNGDIVVIASTNKWASHADRPVIKYEYTSATDTWDATQTQPDTPRPFGATIFEDETYATFGLFGLNAPIYNADGSASGTSISGLSGALASNIYVDDDGNYFILSSPYQGGGDDAIKLFYSEAALTPDFIEIDADVRADFFNNAAIQGDGQHILATVSGDDGIYLYGSVLIQNNVIALYYAETDKLPVSDWSLFTK